IVIIVAPEIRIEDFSNPRSPLFDPQTLQDPGLRFLNGLSLVQSQEERLAMLVDQWSRVTRGAPPPPTAEELQQQRLSSLDVPFVLHDSTYLMLREGLRADRLSVDGPRSKEEQLAIKLGYMLDTTRSELLAVAEQARGADHASRAELGKQASGLQAYYKALHALYTELDLGDVEVSAKYDIYAEGDRVLRASGLDMNSDATIYSRVGDIGREIALGGAYVAAMKDLGDEFTDLLDSAIESPRLAGFAQALGGLAEGGAGVSRLGAPAPGARVGGMILIFNGVDNVQAGLVMLATGSSTSTVTSRLATSGFLALGAPESEAAFLGQGVNLVIPLAVGGWVKLAGTSSILVDARLSSTRGWAPTGIERFDQLAVDSPAWANWVKNLEGRNITLRPSLALNASNPANYLPVAMVLEYHPEYFRYIDLLHESRHIAQFSRATA
ncbi:MAG: hypothetical protein ACRD2D_12805, partial [Terriglobales bacterium]